MFAARLERATQPVGAAAAAARPAMGEAACLAAHRAAADRVPARGAHLADLLRKVGDDARTGQLAVQLEREFAAAHIATRRYLQLLTNDLQVAIETPDQAPQKGEIAFVQLRPGAPRLGKPAYARAQAEFVGHGIDHVSRRHVGVHLAAARHARTAKRVFSEHHQLWRRAMDKFGLKRADHTAEEFAGLGLVAGIHLDGGTEGDPRAVLEGIFGAIVGRAGPVREA